MNLYKVLSKGRLSPFQGFKYELGRKYICYDFDENINNSCSNGFYATELNGFNTGRDRLLLCGFR